MSNERYDMPIEVWYLLINSKRHFREYIYDLLWSFSISL